MHEEPVPEPPATPPATEIHRTVVVGGFFIAGASNHLVCSKFELRSPADLIQESSFWPSADITIGSWLLQLSSCKDASRHSQLFATSRLDKERVCEDPTGFRTAPPVTSSEDNLLPVETLTLLCLLCRTSRQGSKRP